MKPSSFDYVSPVSVQEAAIALEENPGAMIIAGGQSLVPALNFKLASPAMLVDIKKIPDLDKIFLDNQKIVIGANVKHVQVEENTYVKDNHPLMVEALKYVAHGPIRNQGTTVGSLCHADSAAEMPIILVLTDGYVTAVSSEGERTISAGEFFKFHMTTSRKDSEMITHAHFPIPDSNSGYSFLEFARRSGDYAISAIAVLMNIDENNQISSVKVAAGGISSCPIRLLDVEEVLLGSMLDESDVKKATEICRRFVTAPADVHATVEYRKGLTCGLLAKALVQAKERAKKGFIG